MKEIADIITRFEAKEIDIHESIAQTDTQIRELEQRKRYLEGRMYEVQSIQTLINEMQGGI